MNKKIIIFGGTFDPIHNFHIKIAKIAIKKINADKLYFVPCALHPNSKKIYSTNQQRIDMLQIATKKIKDKFEISFFEIEKNNISYSIETINHFKDIYPNDDLYLLLGYDQLINFKNWKDYELILQKVKIICYPRKISSDVKDIDIVNHIKLKRKAYNNVSSSKLRIKPNLKYLNKDVLSYINDNGIYAILRLKEVMSDYRLQHSIRVANIAVEISKQFNDHSLLKKAYVAGIYHDYAKQFDIKIQKSFWTRVKLWYFNFPSWKVIHGPLGAYEVKKRFHIIDKDVLSAIKNHTIPLKKTTLNKIIYCADKLDVRHDGTIENFECINETAKNDVDKAFEMIQIIMNKNNF